jgi:hypothetical protein
VELQRKTKEGYLSILREEGESVNAYYKKKIDGLNEALHEKNGWIRVHVNDMEKLKKTFNRKSYIIAIGSYIIGIVFTLIILKVGGYL